LKIRKNATNSTAGFFYGLGCSLVHLCMFFAILFIDRPHLEKAKEMDKKYYNDIKPKFPEVHEDHQYFCQSEVEKFDNLITQFIILHFCCAFVCLYREIKDANVDFFGTIMKGLEILSIYFYFGMYIQSLSMFSFWMYDLPVSKLIEYVDTPHLEEEAMIIFK